MLNVTGYHISTIVILLCIVLVIVLLICFRCGVLGIINIIIFLRSDEYRLNKNQKLYIETLGKLLLVANHYWIID